MDAKELIAHLVDIVEKDGNVDIQVQVLGYEHDFEVVKNRSIEKYVLEVKS